MKERGAILDVAIESAIKAGDFLQQHLGGGKSVSTKSSTVDLVTEYDRKSQEIIIDIIHSYYPRHSVLAEEEDQISSAEKKWVVDPLDGTTNYIHDYPLFATSVAFEEQGVVQVGAVYIPLLNQLFTGAKGVGSFLNGAPIEVSGRESLSDSLVSTGFPYEQEEVKRALQYFNALVRNTRGIRRDGAAAIDLCYVAAGKYDAFWEIGLSPWDVAAGSLIVEEAGGMITDLMGSNFSIYDSEAIVSSNGEVHQQLLRFLEGGVDDDADS